MNFGKLMNLTTSLNFKHLCKYCHHIFQTMIMKNVMMSVNTAQNKLLSFIPSFSHSRILSIFVYKTHKIHYSFVISCDTLKNTALNLRLRASAFCTPIHFPVVQLNRTSSHNCRFLTNKPPRLIFEMYYGALLSNECECCSTIVLSFPIQIHATQMCYKHLSSIIHSVVPHS